MTTATVPAQKESTHLSEIFPLHFDSLKTARFRLSPATTKEEGFRLSFRLSRHFPNIVVVWDAGYLYALAAKNENMPKILEWQTALAHIQHELPEAGDRTWSLRASGVSELTAEIQAQLAEQAL